MLDLTHTAPIAAPEPNSQGAREAAYPIRTHALPVTQERTAAGGARGRAHSVERGSIIPTPVRQQRPRAPHALLENTTPMQDPAH